MDYLPFNFLGYCLATKFILTIIFPTLIFLYLFLQMLKNLQFTNSSCLSFDSAQYLITHQLFPQRLTDSIIHINQFILQFGQLFFLLSYYFIVKNLLKMFALTAISTFTTIRVQYHTFFGNRVRSIRNSFNNKLLQFGLPATKTTTSSKNTTFFKVIMLLFQSLKQPAAILQLGVLKCLLYFELGTESYLSFESHINIFIVLGHFFASLDCFDNFAGFVHLQFKLNQQSMLVKKIIPFKFLAAVLQIVIAGVLLSTAQLYPTLNNTSQSSFVIGCILIIVFTFLQIMFTIVGINVYNIRVHFQNLIINIVGLGLLVWFALALWQREYIWYIWGFLTVYPLGNELIGLISVMCHNKKLIFEKYRSQQ